MFNLLCKIGLHKWKIWEFWWFQNQQRIIDSPLARDGYYRVSKLYCSRCGIIRKLNYDKKTEKLIKEK